MTRKTAYFAVIRLDVASPVTQTLMIKRVAKKLRLFEHADGDNDRTKDVQSVSLVSETLLRKNKIHE